MDHANSRLGKSNEPIFDPFRRSFETGFFLRNVIYTVLPTPSIIKIQEPR